MNVIELATILNKELAITPFDEYNGIQVMNDNGPLIHIATAVTADLSTIEKAIELGVQALVVHHGLFRKHDSHILQGMTFNRIKRLINHNIALLGYHLPLDKHESMGNNWKAARDMGWQNLQPFGEWNKTAIGVRGEFQPMAYDIFKNKIESYYQHPAVTAYVQREIRSAALISGSAYKYIELAAQVGVDAFITGNFDESAWYLAHELQISFFALGHAATEKVGPKAIADYINQTLQIKTTFIDTNNPF